MPKQRKVRKKKKRFLASIRYRSKAAFWLCIIFVRRETEKKRDERWSWKEKKKEKKSKECIRYVYV